MLRARSRQRGFTLIELMVVVLIMGVLAAVGARSFREQMSRSRNTEALAMLRSVGAAQERFRDHHMIYLDVSSNLTTYYPPNPVRGGAVQTFWGWAGPLPDVDNWKALAPEAPHNVGYQYSTIAGLPLTAPTGLDPDIPSGRVQFPAAANIKEPWYVIVARGDQDGDGTYNFIVSSSFGPQVFQVSTTE